MSKSIPSFPLPCDFKTCPEHLTHNISNYFYDLSNYLQDCNIALRKTHESLVLASRKFAHGEISQFLFARSLTQSEYSISDTIKNLTHLYDSLRDIANPLRNLLPPSDPDRAEPSPDTPTDFSTKH